MQKSLKISPAPFKPSRLSIPPSPFSPCSPFTPAVPHRYQSQRTNEQGSTATSETEVHAPSTPLRWTWKCHQCRNIYGLGVIRRCLEDGHYYCSGSTTIKAWRKPTNARRTKKRGTCSSEFDYSGWKEWSRWRRGAPRDKATSPNNSPVDDKGEALDQKKRDCWNMCNYPSECRWGKKFGIHTPVETCFPVSEINTMPTLDVPVKTTSEGILKPDDCGNIKVSNKDATLSLWTALLVSAEKRKNNSRRASSPLSAITEEDWAIERDSDIMSSPQDDRDDATIAATGSSVPSDSDASQPSSSTTPLTVGGSLKPLLSRRRYRRGSSSATHNSEKTKQMREISTSNSEQKITSEALKDWPPLTRMYSRRACFV